VKTAAATNGTLLGSICSPQALGKLEWQGGRGFYHKLFKTFDMVMIGAHGFVTDYPWLVHGSVLTTVVLLYVWCKARCMAMATSPCRVFSSFGISTLHPAIAHAPPVPTGLALVPVLALTLPID
jgi:hypothetical protein